MSYKVIARKYRPQTFSDLVGQQHVTKTLANAIQSNRVAHAYIFSGVRGVGKTTTARILAKALNCVKGPTAEPDNTCDACREIAAGTSLDVLEIDAASNRGIDQIRELREMVRYAPASSRYKVVILDEAHQLTDEASNALLKTLEEPPERVVFILATTRAEDLVETIKSRAQLFQFRALTFQEIAGEIERVAKAENLSIDPAPSRCLRARRKAACATGFRCSNKPSLIAATPSPTRRCANCWAWLPKACWTNSSSAIAAQSAERALGLVHRLIADGQNLQHFCREAIRHFRNLLVTRVCGADSNLIAAPDEERPRLAEQAAQFGEEDLTRFFNILLATDDDLRRKPDPRLHLELGLLKLINAQRLAPLEEIVSELRGGVNETPRVTKPPAPPARAVPAAQAPPSVSPFSPARPASPASISSTADSSGGAAAVRMAPEPKASTFTSTDEAKPASFAQPRTELSQATPIGLATAPAEPVREIPAVTAAAPVPASPPRVVARVAEESVNGLLAAQVDAIKAALQGQNFCGRWSSTLRAGKSRAASCVFFSRPKAARSRKCCRRATRWSVCAQF